MNEWLMVIGKIFAVALASGSTQFDVTVAADRGGHYQAIDAAGMPHEVYCGPEGFYRVMFVDLRGQPTAAQVSYAEPVLVDKSGVIIHYECVPQTASAN